MTLCYKLNIKQTKQKIKFLILIILLRKTDYNTKTTEIEGNIPDIRNLATKIALTTVENKIPNVSNLVKKQIITLKLQKLRIRLIIIIMTNILQLQSLILHLQMFLI